MPDSELLELLLFFSIRYVDVKPLAKQLLDEFGLLGGVLAAAPERLEAVVRQGDAAYTDRLQKDCQFTITHLKAMQRLLQRVLAEDVMAKPVLSSWQALLDYLKVALGHEPIEQFRVLFLDKKTSSSAMRCSSAAPLTIHRSIRARSPSARPRTGRIGRGRGPQPPKR